MAALTSIEGIGEQHAAQLAEARIGTTQALLARGATRAGRKQIAACASLTPQQILRWVNRADLFRIRGVGEEYSDLLEATGVDTVPELSRRKPERLVQQMHAVNDRRHLVRRLPACSEVKRWVREAKVLPRMIRY